MDSTTIREKHKQYLWPCVANFYAEPLVLDRGEGCRVTDLDGRSYLDFFGGILTVSLGHCQPDITDAVVAQARRLPHTSSLYPNQPAVALAEKLAAITPGRLQQTFFTNSGTEADENAVLVARLFTGNHDLVVLRHAYSGRSMLNLNLTAQSVWRQQPSLVPGIKYAHNAYCYRCAFGASYPHCDLRCARDAEELILTETNGRVAGLLAEPIQGAGGFIVPPPGYFEVLVEIVRKYGGVFIADEVQTGFGRTGGKWWGIQNWDVDPDIMTMAKGMANGFPIGATVATPEVAASLKGLTICTFGGNPVSTAAALATIGVIEREGVLERAGALGQRFCEGLDALKDRHPVIGDVRGMGLMQGVELVKDRETKEPAPQAVAQLLEEARKQGLLIGKGGLYGNVLRIAPPMLIGESEIDEALSKLDAAFEALPA